MNTDFKFALLTVVGIIILLGIFGSFVVLH